MAPPALRKLNLGAGRGWSRDGWATLDHSRLRPFALPDQAWRLPWADGTFDTVFTSHMIEHISAYRIEQTFAEINRVMTPGGVLRILTPDLEKLCRAYVDRDLDTLRAFIAEDNQGKGNGMRDDLGPAQVLLGFLSSPGYDNFLIDSSRSRMLGGYAHVFGFDYELLSKLLSHYGFSEVERKSIDESAIPEHRHLRSVPHDTDKHHSLVVECRKDRYVPFIPQRSLLLNGPYVYDEVVGCRQYRLTKAALMVSARLENFYFWGRRAIGTTLRGLGIMAPHPWHRKTQ